VDTLIQEQMFHQRWLGPSLGNISLCSMSVRSDARIRSIGNVQSRRAILCSLLHHVACRHHLVKRQCVVRWVGLESALTDNFRGGRQTSGSDHTDFHVLM